MGTEDETAREEQQNHHEDVIAQESAMGSVHKTRETAKTGMSVLG